MFGREPVLWMGAIQAVILCAVTFGLKWSSEQVAIVMTVAGALMALFTRSQVSPLDSSGKVIKP